MIDDIHAALQERTALIAGETIVGWGVSYAPVVGEPYLHVTMPARSSQPMAVGPEPPEMWRGTLQLLVCHPALEGEMPAIARARAVRDNFPIGLTLLKNSARITIERRDIQPSYPMPDWINVPVLVSWFAEEHA